MLAVGAILLGLLGFAAFWTGIVVLLGRMAGWPSLMERFPDRDEQPLLSLHMQSGCIGANVQLSGVLSLAACPSGLRVGIFRMFGPFSRPFLVPWREIATREAESLIWPQLELEFGRPPVGRLTISAAVWQRLAAAAGAAPRSSI